MGEQPKEQEYENANHAQDDDAGMVRSAVRSRAHRVRADTGNRYGVMPAHAAPDCICIKGAEFP